MQPRFQFQIPHFLNFVAVHVLREVYLPPRGGNKSGSEIATDPNAPAKTTSGARQRDESVLAERSRRLAILLSLWLSSVRKRHAPSVADRHRGHSSWIGVTGGFIALAAGLPLTLAMRQGRPLAALFTLTPSRQRSHEFLDA